jgi:hypothetical protein
MKRGLRAINENYESTMRESNLWTRGGASSNHHSTFMTRGARSKTRGGAAKSGGAVKRHGGVAETAGGATKAGGGAPKSGRKVSLHPRPRCSETSERCKLSGALGKSARCRSLRMSGGAPKRGGGGALLTRTSKNEARGGAASGRTRSRGTRGSEKSAGGGLETTRGGRLQTRGAPKSGHLPRAAGLSPAAFLRNAQ